MEYWQVNLDGQAFPLTMLGPVDNPEAFEVVASEWLRRTRANSNRYADMKKLLSTEPWDIPNIEVRGSIVGFVFEAIRAARLWRTDTEQAIKNMRTKHFAQGLGDTFAHADWSTRLSHLFSSGGENQALIRAIKRREQNIKVMPLGNICWELAESGCDIQKNTGSILMIGTR